MKTPITRKAPKALNPKTLYTGQTVTYKGQKVSIVEVEPGGEVCIELPNGETLWVSPKTLST